MESANAGNFLDIDKQAPRMLWNYAVTWEHNPAGNGYVDATKFFVPEYVNASSNKFMDGYFNESQCIGSFEFDGEGTATFIVDDPSNPVPTENTSFGNLKARFW